MKATTMTHRLAKICSILPFAVLDFMTVAVNFKLLLRLFGALFAPYEMPFVSRLMFALEILLILSCAISGILYFLRKKIALVLYLPQFALRIAFAVFSFGFLLRVNSAFGFFPSQAVFYACVALEIARLVLTVIMLAKKKHTEDTQ